MASDRNENDGIRNPISSILIVLTANQLPARQVELLFGLIENGKGELNTAKIVCP